MNRRLRKLIVFGGEYIRPKSGGLRNPNTRFIYHLSDPETSEVCYVGQTSSPENMYKVYCRCSGSFSKDSMLSRWLKGLRADGLIPVMTILMQLNGLECDTDWEELKMIKHYWKLSHPLLNAYCRDVMMLKKHYVWKERISTAHINKRVKVI